MIETQINRQSETAAKLPTEGYPRPVCLTVAQGARDIAKLPKETGQRQNALRIIAQSVHPKIMEVLSQEEVVTPNSVAETTLRHISSFDFEKVSPDSIILHGNFGGRESGFLIDLKRHLGRGGFNDAFEGIEATTGRRITVRRLHNYSYKRSFNDAEERAAIETAQAVMLNLTPHANLVRFWGAAQDVEGNEYTIPDYAPGENLEGFLEETEGEQTFNNFVSIALDIANGLHHYHKNGLVHRDIKPKNGIVNTGNDNTDDDKNLHTRLIDIDTIRTYQDYANSIKLGRCAGSPLYMSPEQFFARLVPNEDQEQRLMAEAGDVYSLGITYFNMLTGTYPPELLQASNPDELVNAKISMSDFSLLEKYPKELREVIEAMCNPEWRKRPPLCQVISMLNTHHNVSTLETPLSRIQGPVPKSDFINTIEQYGTVFMAPEYTIGKYKMIDEVFAQKKVETGKVVNLAKLQEARSKREKIGIPYSFAKKEDAYAFFERKSIFFRKLNAVRLKHPELFPGTFDLYLHSENDEGPFTVWVIREFVKATILFDDYLEHYESTLERDDKWELLMCIARSLAALEGAGYRHPDLSPQNIFLAPPDYLTDSVGRTIISPATLFMYPSSGTGIVGKIMHPQGALCFPKDQIFYRLELMDTSMAVEITDERDPNVEKFINIIQRVIPDISYDLLVALREETITWEERVELLIEKQDDSKIMH